MSPSRNHHQNFSLQEASLYCVTLRFHRSSCILIHFVPCKLTFLVLLASCGENSTRLFVALLYIKNYIMRLMSSFLQSTYIWSSPRPISTGPLNALLRLHSRPIHHVFFMGPYSFLQDGISHLEEGFTLRCFQRLSRPDLATQLCHWCDNWYTIGLSIPVLSY